MNTSIVRFFVALRYNINFAILFTNTTFTADIGDNVTLSWTTSLTEFYDVFGPTGPPIHSVQFNLIVPHTDGTKYKYSKMRSRDVNSINITVMNVMKTDAGQYRSKGHRFRDMIDNGCCVLVVTSMISFSIS